MLRYVAIIWLALCAPCVAAYKPQGVPVVVALTSAQLQGTAFQPCPLSDCKLNLIATLGGALALANTVTIAESSSSAFTSSVTVATYDVTSVALGTAHDTHMILVPKGYWIKITLSNLSILSSMTMNSAAWSN